MSINEETLFDASEITVSMGPQHPSTHGVLQVKLKLDGERVVDAECVIGYLHRGVEKLGEAQTWGQWVPTLDRMDYIAAVSNCLGYCETVEKMLGVQAPPRAQYIRTIMTELNRITSHLLWLGTHALDIGAMTVFLYAFREREEILKIFENYCGARLTTSYTRIGGLMHDAPAGWEKEVKDWVVRTRKTVKEMDQLLTNNRIWCDRTQGVGVFTREQCMAYSYTGPNARAAGINRDLRRDEPTMFYKNVEFDVPVGKNGDVFDRYMVRMAEIFQSLNIIAQCADKMQPGPIWVEDKRVRIPEKDVVHNTMEGLIHHFKFFMSGFDVPAGEAYTAFEATNGELAFYIVSKGGPRAHRMRIRGPSVWHYQGLSEMTRGLKIADMVAALGSINIIAGELDR